MEFETDLPFTEPDAQAYEALKGVHTIDHQPGTALSESSLLADSPLVNMFGPARFEAFIRPRLVTAMLGLTGREHLARFPGTLVPALGNNGSQASLGSLLYDRFQAASYFQGGVCSSGRVEPFSTHSTQPCEYWPWSYPEPPLVTIVPDAQREDPNGNAQTLLNRLGNREYECPLSAIRRGWAPLTGKPLPKVHDEVARVSLEAGWHSVPFYFELEDALAYALWLDGKKSVGMGVYRGCWLEVYLWPLRGIRNTELAQTPRVLQELHTLITRGFAPIVINEYGANVDGTHRQTASWIWNLLHCLEASDLETSSQDELDRKVTSFATHHAQDMGPVMTREVLRIFAEFMDDPASRTALTQVIFPKTRELPEIAAMPVIPLREQSWPTVRYHEYIGGMRAVRVDPAVYAAMRDRPELVLPAHGHGPYHLTDRALVPWFNVLEINAQH
jgi:hypothetical protein